MVPPCWSVILRNPVTTEIVSYREWGKCIRAVDTSTRIGPVLTLDKTQSGQVLEIQV